MSDAKERARLYADQEMREIRNYCQEMDRDILLALVGDELRRAYFVGWAAAVEEMTPRGRK